MSTEQKPEAPAGSAKQATPPLAPKRVDTLSERAMRSCWMPFWKPVESSDIDPSKPPYF